MATSKLTHAQVAKLLGLTSKQISRYREQGMPHEGSGRQLRYLWPEARAWRDDLIRRQEREKVEARLRPREGEEVARALAEQKIAESRLIQMEVAEREGRLLTVEAFERTVGDLCDRLRARLINIPANYELQLEHAGVPGPGARALLEAIADDLTRSLRESADELDAEGADGDDGVV